MGIGLVLIVAAMPFASVRFHSGPVENRVLLLNDDDLWMAVFVAVVGAVLLLAAVVRKPVVLTVALVPVAVVFAYVLLIGADIQFGTSFLADRYEDRVNLDRALATGGVLNLLGMFVVVFGLAIPLLEARRQRVVSR